MKRHAKTEGIYYPVPFEKPRKENKVGRTAHGDEFRKSLKYSKDYCLDHEGIITEIKTAVRDQAGIDL